MTIPHSIFTLQHSFCGREEWRDATKYKGTPGLARAADQALEIGVGRERRSYTREELLARPDAGASDVGPDLNLPMNPTEYMTEAGLHALIRDPKSVRTWPGMKMNGLPSDLRSDTEIGLFIIGYLKHMAGRKVVQ